MLSFAYFCLTLKQYFLDASNSFFISHSSWLWLLMMLLLIVTNVQVRVHTHR